MVCGITEKDLVFKTLWGPAENSKVLPGLQGKTEPVSSTILWPDVNLPVGLINNEFKILKPRV
jgi:hypothetical protein